MKAIVQSRYGSAEVLEFRKVEDPLIENETCSSGCRRPGAVQTSGT